MSSVAAVATSAMSSATTATAAPAATARTSSATTTISAVAAMSSVAAVRRSFAIEIRLIRFIRKIAAPFNHQRAALRWLALGRHCRGFRSTSAALRRHLRALLL